MVFKPNSNISKLDSKTVVTAWHSPHFQCESFNTGRDFNFDTEISAPRYVPDQAWDLQSKGIMSY
jgi:hypothetical protein